MIIGAIAMTATSAQAQNRSDLICDVKFSTLAEGFPLMEAERTLRFSVDTDAMKWCREECADVEDLVEATGAKLTTLDGFASTGHVEIASLTVRVDHWVIRSKVEVAHL